MTGRPTNPPPENQTDLYPNARGGELTLTCKQCGRTFHAPAAILPRGKPIQYCSRACKAQHLNHLNYTRRKPTP